MKLYVPFRFLFPKKECLGNCPKKFVKPVCATNGRTLQNPCILDFVICNSKGKIQKARDGKCCPNQCSSKSCGRGRKCVWSFKTCKLTCPCAKSCANTKCPHRGICKHNSKTCQTKCSKSLLLNIFLCLIQIAMPVKWLYGWISQRCQQNFENYY